MSRDNHLNKLYHNVFQHVGQYLDWSTLNQVLQTSQAQARSVQVTLPQIMKHVQDPILVDLTQPMVYQSFLKSPATSEARHLKILNHGSTQTLDHHENLVAILSKAQKVESLDFDVFELTRQSLDRLLSLKNLQRLTIDQLLIKSTDLEKELESIPKVHVDTRYTYDRENLVWMRRKRAPEAVIPGRKPLTEYQMFVRDQMPIIRNQGVAMTERMLTLAQMWKELRKKHPDTLH